LGLVLEKNSEFIGVVTLWREVATEKRGLKLGGRVDVDY